MRSNIIIKKRILIYFLESTILMAKVAVSVDLRLFDGKLA